MTIPSLSPFQKSQQSTPNLRLKKQDNASAAQKVASSDSVQFAGKQASKNKMGNGPEINTGDRFTGAWKAIKKDITSLSWWGKQTAIATAITVATCWLPGSQLFTIPLWLGISLTMQGIDGFSNPTQYNAPAPAKQPAEQDKKWSGGQKAKGALKGFGSGVIHGIKDDFGKKALLSGALCVATCWLPGSQLLLVPALFCSYGAWEGIQRGIKGWNHPAQYGIS
jgi:hypothetical protein